MTKVTVVLTVSVTPEETQLTIQTSLPNPVIEDCKGLAEIKREIPLLLLTKFLEGIEDEVKYQTS